MSCWNCLGRGVSRAVIPTSPKHSQLSDKVTKLGPVINQKLFEEYLALKWNGIITLFYRCKMVQVNFRFLQSSLGSLGSCGPWGPWGPWGASTSHSMCLPNHLSCISFIHSYRLSRDFIFENPVITELRSISGLWMAMALTCNSYWHMYIYVHINYEIVTSIPFGHVPSTSSFGCTFLLLTQVSQPFFVFEKRLKGQMSRI